MELGRCVAAAVAGTLLAACQAGVASPTALELCVAQHPTSKPDAQATEIAGVLVDCLEDSGPCKTRECTGSAEARICDEARLMSKEAAVCIALSAGLEPGIGDLKARIQYDRRLRRIIWTVTNVMYDRSTPANLDRGGLVHGIDAVTGERLFANSWSAVS